VIYSPSKNAFYAPEFRADYDAAGTWPDDAVEVSEELYAQTLNPPAGKIRVAGADGLPALIDLPVESEQQARERALFDIREERKPILNALAGIGFDAMVSGDTATVDSVASTRLLALGITDWPAFLAAQTYDDMKAAVMARYQEIAASVPANVQTTFREVLG